MTPELEQALAALRRPVLVGLDFDGVLAPIVARPGDATPLPGSMDAVAALAALPQVWGALVSGRARSDLAERAGVPLDGPVRLVGSHGAELGPGRPDDDGASGGLSEADRARLAAVQAALEAVSLDFPGAHVETKPSAAVLHTRQVARGDAQRATAAALHAVAGIAGAHVTRGKEVVEVAVTEASKGAAIEHLRSRLGAAAVLYIGDDVTDETVFRLLGDGDVGVKVGDGDTAATFRLADPADVRELLRSLVTLLR